MEKFNVKCRADKIVFKNIEGNYHFISFSPYTPIPEQLKLSQYNTFLCKGNLPFIKEGKEYELEIAELETNYYKGKTSVNYKIISVPSIKQQELESLTRADSEEILNEITTTQQTQYILEAYPDFIYKAVTNGIEDFDIKKIFNVGDTRLNYYVRELNERYKYIHVLNKFKQWNVDISDCQKLCNQFENIENIEKQFETKPYPTMISILGNSFASADKLILENMPQMKKTKQRCEHFLLSVLERHESEGSTRLNGNDLYYGIIQDYNVPELTELIVPTVKESDLIYYDEKSKDVSIMETYLGECKIADFIKDKLENSHKLDIDWTKYTNVDGFELTDEQSGILRLFCEKDFVCLTGVAGGGKSSAVKNLIIMCEENNISYTLLTPTGVSAKRLSEILNGRTTSTIHRKVLKDKEIWTDLILLDETGMVDLPTFIMLINSIKNQNAKIVLVADPSQLNSVGVGTIMTDIVNSNIVPMANLTKVFRYDNDGALFVSSCVREGKEFFNDESRVVNQGREYIVGNNYKFIEAKDDEIFNILIKEYKCLINKGIKPNDIMVLSPYNVGEIGSIKINNTIQSIINPPIPNEKYLTRKVGKNNETNILFRKGDKVLNTKNDYKALPLESYEELMLNNELSIDDVQVSAIFNGQQGTVREVQKDYMVVQFDQELIVITKSNLSNILLGSSISIHKSQGSQQKYVFNIVSPQHEKMLNKNILYVATTRCQIKTIAIGSTNAFNRALKIDGNALRNTWLLELLQEKIAK